MSNLGPMPASRLEALRPSDREPRRESRSGSRKPAQRHEAQEERELGAETEWEGPEDSHQLDERA